MSGTWRSAAYIGLSLVLLAGATGFSDRSRSGGEDADELLYVPSGPFVREVVLGYDHAAAAILWLRAVQYYGQHKRTDNRFDMMYHLSDIITDLDPHFEEPYLFGSLVILTENDDYQEALDLLEKARNNNPESWRIFFESGFVRYVFWKDYEGAMPFFRRAAEIDGAPERTVRFAAYVASRSGELETALLLWKEVARNSSNPEMRRKALDNMREIDARIRSRSADGR